MSSQLSSDEKQISAALLMAYAAGQFGFVLLEIAMVSTGAAPRTDLALFVQMASLSYVMLLFLSYLLLGALGFVGTLGLARVYGAGTGLLGDIVQVAGLGYFLMSYWLWASMWIVQHKLTLLAERPTNPPEWLLQIFVASEAFWSLAAWAALGPALVLFTGLALLLLRGARSLPRYAAYAFATLAVSQFASLVVVAVRGFGVADAGAFGFAFLNDALFTVVRVIAFVLAAGAVYTERGVFVRTRRTT